MIIKKNNFYIKLLIFISLIWTNALNSNPNKENLFKEKFDFKNKNKITEKKINWEKLNIEKSKMKNIIWEIIDGEYSFDKEKSQEKNYIDFNYIKVNINSLNRSIVFDNKTIGPDISWLVPPGFQWNEKRKFDASVRGHSRRDPGEGFLNWNGGDAVGQFYYQFINKQNYSFGINYGVRSIYQGSAAGGATPFGEGGSLGFRWDYKISKNSGFAFGGEQILHFDGKTDTGRDLYLTYSKAFWSENIDGIFPLNVITAGVGTGKLAEGNIKGLCSDFLGGSGTEILHQRRLCWSPIFSISRVYNQRYSNFFEYNSKEFIVGASLAPSKKVPLRGTFAITIADHIDNYKLKGLDELRWVFRLSLGL